MQAWFYKWLSRVARHIGPWFFAFWARLVAAGFFVFSPRQVAAGARFYRVLFPDRRGAALGLVWRQYQQFTTVFIDRFLLYHAGGLRDQSESWHRLNRLVDEGRGVIILMSHMGNWEAAAHFLKRKTSDVPLLLYMGTRQKEQIERLQKHAMQRQGLRIVAVDQRGGSSFNLLEGLQTLRAGGVVSMTGDRLWHLRQRSVAVNFLGKKVRVPETPYRFAQLARCPIVPFFALRTAPRRYTITALDPIFVRPGSRSGRAAAVQTAAQRYADCLAQMVRQYPDQWYHFGAFFQHPDS